MDIHNTNTDIPQANASESDEELRSEPNTVRRLQLKLAKRKKQCIKVKSRIRSCQLILEEQDEKLSSFQERMAKIQCDKKEKPFDWSVVKAAHLVSKIFERCEPIVADNSKYLNSDDNLQEVNDQEYSNNNKDLVVLKSDNNKIGETASNQSKSTESSYTADFHRFAIALYFFSPKTYFFLSTIIPMLPHKSYIRQWVTAGRMEKLFPPGVYREEFNR